MSESYFQMKDLSVGYHGNVLIHDICTEIKKGEILTLIGPNGSGNFKKYYQAAYAHWR